MGTLSITILPQGLVLVLKLYFTEPGSIQMLNKEMVHSPKQVVIQVVRETSQVIFKR